MEASEYVARLQQLFEQHRDVDKAMPMSKYMREQFDFYGLQQPLRMKLTRQFWSEYGAPESDKALQAVVKLCWQNDYREVQYFGLDTIIKRQKHLSPGFIKTLEWLVRKKSWWDTVDKLASPIIGTHFQNYPDLIPAYTKKWCNANNIWINRIAILFQLRYKNKTDENLLYSLMEQMSDSEEFFIQKAMGWALREYSKTNSFSVVDFIRSTKLPALTKREALKWMKAKGVVILDIE